MKTEHKPRPTEYHWIGVFADGRQPTFGLEPADFTDVRDDCKGIVENLSLCPESWFTGLQAIHILDSNGHVVLTMTPT